MWTEHPSNQHEPSKIMSTICSSLPFRMMTFTKRLDTVFNLLIPSKFGARIPQAFASNLSPEIISQQLAEVQEAITFLAEKDVAPIQLRYWQEWETIIDGFSFTDKNGHTFTLHEGRSLWAFDQTKYSALTLDEMENLWNGYIF